MEAQLAETQRLATIGETASMVGHDLRNPLQAMVGSLWLLKELIMSKKPEDLKEAQDLLTTLRESARYMNKIVSDLQDYAGPVESETVEINPLEVVKTSLADVKIPENINVSVDVNGSSSGVRVDPALLRRVLTNLILNAVQAMPNGGKLRVYSTVEQESLTLSVEDSGVGIAPESLPKLFTPFFTTKAKGQGLGLAVCKRLMDVQGGRIDVTNHPGEGTIFTLKVPSKSRRRDSAEASVRKSG
jgi:signal transduction histidine kinase